jgi:hypothetical protein
LLNEIKVEDMLDQGDDASDSVSVGVSDGSCDEAPQPSVRDKRKKTESFPSLIDYMFNMGQSLASRARHLFGIGNFCPVDDSVFSVIEICCHGQ